MCRSRKMELHSLEVYAMNSIRFSDKVRFSFSIRTLPNDNPEYILKKAEKLAKQYCENFGWHKEFELRIQSARMVHCDGGENWFEMVGRRPE